MDAQISIYTSSNILLNKYLHNKNKKETNKVLVILENYNIKYCEYRLRNTTQDNTMPISILIVLCVCLFNVVLPFVIIRNTIHNIFNFFFLQKHRDEFI